MKKRIWSLSLVVCMLLSITLPAFGWEIMPYDPNGTPQSSAVPIMISNCPPDSYGTITIPAYAGGMAVGCIDDTVFSNSNYVKNIEVEAGSLFFVSEDGVLFSKDKKILIRYPHNNDRSTYVIPDGVEIIEREAFLYSKNLTSIEIPESVNTIRNAAFFGCSNLKTVDYASSGETRSAISYGENNKPLTDAEARRVYREASVSKNDVVISVVVNGTAVAFDQPPVLENGRTLVPLRAIFEALGANIGWDDTTKTVTASKDGTEISLQIGSNEMYVNGVAKTLDVPAKLINSRTLVPVRAISEAFNCQVNWIDETKTVVITL